MPSRLNVLWATDGSKNSLAAAPLIRSLLLPVAGTVRVLAVAPRPMFSGARLGSVSLPGLAPRDRDAAVSEALAVAKDAAASLEGVYGSVVAEARFGHPVQEIIRTAEQVAADVIVVGAKGQSALRMMLLGSIAQGVLDYARRPVLIVRPGSEEVSTAVVGIDGSREALKALGFLCRLALEPDALVVLTEVVELVSQKRSAWSSAPVIGADEARKLNDAAMKLAEHHLAAANDVLFGTSVQADNEILVGHAGRQLIASAVERDADLIVVGSRPPSRGRRYLVGSTAELVAREALTSVLVVR